jgi:glycerol-3-phosphate dehydrogenase
MWERLDGEVDLLVIGGGINGAGIARDAARRGMTVAVVEMNDIAFGTSSRSSKLIHGGVRYLEHYEFSLVFEAVSERRILMDLAPHLVDPLGFLFPIYDDSRHKLWMITAGMWLYDGLSLFRSPKVHKKLKAKDVRRAEPALKRGGLKGASLYYDCSTDDARLTLENALDAVDHGAVFVTWCRAESFVRDESGRLRGAVVRDALGDGTKEVRAKALVNATGPWTEQTIAMTGAASSGMLRPTKGVHIVVPSKRLPVRHAVVCYHPSDERVLFAIPWGDRTYVGTTDTDYDGDPSEVAATGADVRYLIDAVNAYFPEHQLEPGDVISTWAGIRPLMAPPMGEDDIAESAVSREHQILVGKDGLITIAGGKLTTYRRMSAEVVDTVARLLELSDGFDKELQENPRTDKSPLPGAVGWPDDDDHDAVAREVVDAGAPHVPDGVARLLGDTYGMRALSIARLCRETPALARRLVDGRPEIVAQVDWAVDQELAATVSDVMIRRTQLFYRDVDQGLGAAELVADRMAELLGWSAETRRQMLDAYRADVARSRAWRVDD